jgi:hypothetical protein
LPCEELEDEDYRLLNSAIPGFKYPLDVGAGIVSKTATSWEKHLVKFPKYHPLTLIDGPANSADKEIVGIYNIRWG